MLVAADWTAVGGEPYIHNYLYILYILFHLHGSFFKKDTYVQAIFTSLCVYIYIPMTSDIFAVHVVYNLYGFLARLQEHTAPPTSDPPDSTGYPTI